MREIKFRGKRIDEDSPKIHEWVYGNLVKNENGDCWIIGDCIESNQDYFSPEWWEPVDPETVGQYTGKDKNGKEIYEIIGNIHDK